MSDNVIFLCDYARCNNAIASKDLNAIQLKALRTWRKTCDHCGKATKWTEQTSLFDTKTTTHKRKNGVSNVTPNH